MPGSISMTAPRCGSCFDDDSDGAADSTFLIYAIAKSSRTSAGAAWLDGVIEATPLRLSELVLSAFLRNRTNPRAPGAANPDRDRIATVEHWRNRSNCVVVNPGHTLGIFTRLCRDAGAKATRPDAYLAALAIESGSDWATTDRGFARSQA